MTVNIIDTKNWHSKLPGNEFDYLALMEALQDYKRPRDKVSKLLRRGDIIRIKKGFYVLGPGLRKTRQFVGKYWLISSTVLPMFPWNMLCPGNSLSRNASRP